MVAFTDHIECEKIKFLFPKILLIGCIQLETFILLITVAANLEQVSGCTVLKTLHQGSLQILSSAIF